MQNLFSLFLLITPAIIAMMIFIWIRKQHWSVKLSSIFVVCLITFNTFNYYFPDKSLRERYAEKILMDV